MVINCLYNHAYTNWGRPYSYFKWRNEWYAFLKLSEVHKELNQLLSWVDKNILQGFSTEEENGYKRITTLRVRIRIACGFVNKLPTKHFSREMKIELMECIWDAYKQFYMDWSDWYCHWILKLPF